MARSERWTPLAFHAAVLTVLWLVTWQVNTRLGHLPDSAPSGFLHGHVFDGWIRFDSSWYLRAATEGYSYHPGRQSNVAFFPSYPLAIRGARLVVRDAPFAAVLVTVLAGVGATSCFWQWCRDRMDRRHAVVALGVLLLYPYGWFLYGVPYGDALFLLTVLGAFLLVEHDHPVLAGVVGVAATAGRPVGIALTIGLAVRVLEQRGAFAGMRGPGRRRLLMDRLRWRDLGVLVSIAGLALWCAFLWARFDDPFVFSHVQEWWGQPSSPATWLKVDFFRAVAGHDDRQYANGLILQALCALTALSFVPRIWRRFGAGYAVYVFVALAIPLVGSQDFQGLGRYVLAAFPAFAVAGEALAERPALQRNVLACSAAMLLVLTAGFARGYYLT
jgi:hypothetical protein